MGLAQRELEAAGFVTVTLSSIPDLTAAVGVPRLAAIEYPMGRPFGRPGDAEGQRQVLRSALQVVETANEPGSTEHLPFVWPEPRSRSLSHPPSPPPIVDLLRRKPWLLPRLLERDPPTAPDDGEIA